MSYPNSTDNLSFFSITENNIEFPSKLPSIRDDSEIWPNYRKLLKFKICLKIDMIFKE